MIFYIMGKSASGKDKIYKGLMKTFGARDNAGAKNAAVDSAPDRNEGTSVSSAPDRNEGTSVSNAPDTKESAEVNLHPIILYTTRPIRTGEKEGRQYHFTDETGLNAFRKAGKVIEERTYQTIAGPWTYATVDNGLDPRKTNYLAIGTLVSYIKVRDYFGSDLVIPIYIDVSDKNLLTRAMHREADQENPRYKEMCRRFLADSEDFDEEKITAAGITRRYDNNGPLDDCVAEIARTIAEYCNA
jgi:guanylate kinase